MIVKVSFFAFGLIKLILCKAYYGSKLRFSIKSFIYPSASIQIGKKALVNLGKSVSIRRNCEINARNGSQIEIGNNTFLNSGCIITAHKSITIGDNVEFGPNVLVFDHDHKFDGGYKAREFECSEIVIGNNVWIGAGSIILRGSKIGNNAVIAAGSIIKMDVPDNSVVIQKRDNYLR